MSNYSEIANVKKAVQAYADGSYTADVEKLRTVFHENAMVTGFKGDEEEQGSPEPFFKDLQSRPSMKDAGDDFKAEILSIDVTGNIASVKVYQENFFGVVNIEDHLQLVKLGGDWKIISKIYTFLP